MCTYGLHENGDCVVSHEVPSGRVAAISARSTVTTQKPSGRQSVALQTNPFEQEPQSCPHPLSPHSLPAQDGEQAVPLVEAPLPLDDVVLPLADPFDEKPLDDEVSSTT